MPRKKNKRTPFFGGMIAFIVMIAQGFAVTGHCADPFAAIPVPKEPVVLSVSGMIANHNADGRAEFDLATLMSYPSSHISTTTAWTEGINTFEGIAAETLLNIVQANGTIAEFSALNDYTVSINLDDPIKHGAIIAYLHNGQRMSVRDKGPLWLIYPLDSNPELQSPIYRDRMIWQLRSINVK